jgi:beta-phosphoglucomutase-like phosphatase (HAD superfamily)
MIKAVITDFDGTLVDTFLANCCAYCRAFAECGLYLSASTYKKCFGLRFDEFMETVGVTDSETKKKIKELKKAAYPNYFHMLKLNTVLYNTLKCMKESGIKIAIASTATRENLINVLNHLGISDIFDLIFTGENVKHGKPDPDHIRGRQLSCDDCCGYVSSQNQELLYWCYGRACGMGRIPLSGPG